MLSDPCLSCPVCLSICDVGVLCQTVIWIKMKLGTPVGLGHGHIALDGDPAPPPQKGTALQFSAHICCGQMARWIKMSLGMEVSLGPGDFVLDGHPALHIPKTGSEPPNFRPLSIVAKSLDASRWHWHRGGPRSMPHCAIWGPSPLPKRGHSRQFLAHVYCGQTAEWIKMPLDTEVGLGPGDILLNGDPAPPK